MGAITDASEFPAGPLLLRVAPERVESLLESLKKIRESGYLKPALAGKIFGKFMFMSSQHFARLGRALLRPFARRQHESGRVALNPQLRAALDFWIANMSTVRPRDVPMDLTNVPAVVSYSDGEGADAGVGVGVWLPCGKVVAGYTCVPDSVRSLWSSVPSCSDERNDIFQIEAVGPAVILFNFGYLFPAGALWLHFIDNESALAALVKGNSSVMSGECITAYTHKWISHYGFRVWFDRVDSSANPVDKLSRGVFDGQWDLMPISFPPDLVNDLESFIGFTDV